MIHEMRNDDAGYLRWLAEHPAGFVLNCNRHPRPGYLVLHCARCHTISSPTRTNWTTNDYIKICSDSRDRLTRWARDTVGGEARPCGTCAA